MIADAPLTPEQIAALGSALEAVLVEHPYGEASVPHRWAFCWDEMDGCTPLLICALRTERTCQRFFLHPVAILSATNFRAFAAYLLQCYQTPHDPWFDASMCQPPRNDCPSCPFAGEQPA